MTDARPQAARTPPPPEGGDQPGGAGPAQDGVARASAEARSAGALLRAARERQGLHIAALAAAIKVPPAKLDALENGRYDELTDITFVRALAHSVCRVLKIDSRSVLELLPNAADSTLEKVGRGLETPFRERPGSTEPSETRLWHRPVFWIVLVLLVAAAAFLWWPGRSFGWLPSFGTALQTVMPAPKPAAPPATPTAAAVPPAPVAPTVRAAEPAPAEAASAPAVLSETVFSAPAVASTDAPVLPSGIVVVRTSEPSWVEVKDARGNALLSRTLLPGEAVGLDGRLPMRVVIGNAPATELMLRGKAVALPPADRDNVVRLELK